MPESRYSKSQKDVPACEIGPNATCPLSQECKLNGKQKELSEKGSDFGKNGKYQFRYWHLLAALLVTGVAVYKVAYYNKFQTNIA